MTALKIISVFLMSIILFACGSENPQAKKPGTEKTQDILFEGQRKVLENAKDVGEVLADEEQKRKDKMKELGL
tara:strand:- start:3943 stop:4161 length:219 start_codon:yes stop_codon:yes gene_type:complete